MFDRLRRIVREAHRRSLWQVLGIYVASSWGVLQVIEFLIETAGLPDWVQPFALVLLLIGLPIVLATAFVQEGTSGRPESGAALAAPDPATAAGESPPPETAAGGAGTSRRHRLFTWRNALIGGGVAFLVLALAVGGYYALRNVGFSPLATLRAQGVLDARDEILLADFASQSGDSTLAPVVTQALRVDLGNSAFLTLTEASRIASVLERMGRTDAALPEDIALEAATREGIKAVLTGDVSRLGPGHVLTARIIEPATGNTLASFRSVARNDEELIDAIDGLSAAIRSKAGESLRSVARSQPLRAVTTGSLEALRLYSRAVDVSDRGDAIASIPLLERAIEEDPEFAMAHRKLAVELSNIGRSPERARAAATRAYELRTRLTEKERHLADAYYFDRVVGETDRAIQAYEALLALDPEDGTALNNLGLAYLQEGRYEDAERILRRAIRDTDLASPFANLYRLLWITGREDEISALLDTLAARLPGSMQLAGLRSGAHHLRRDWEAAHAYDEPLASADELPAELRGYVNVLLASADLGLGRLEEARRHWAEARRLAARSAEPERALLGAATVQAVNEVIATRDTARAASLLEEALAGVEAADLPPTDAFTAAATLAFAGLPDRGARLADAAAANVPPERRDEAYEQSWRLHRFAQAMARGRYEEAESAIREMRAVPPGCDDVRCDGAFELGLALEAAGRTEEAIAAFELHLDGATDDYAALDAAATGVALERLVYLYSRSGRAQEARARLARMAEMWGAGDEPLASRVRDARRAIGSLAVPADS